MSKLFIPAASLLVIVACTTTTNGIGPSTGGASSAEVSNCHNDCDQMKFFGCNTAADQSACYDDCGTATSAQISKFDGCAMTSICDPDCRNDITPPPASGGTPTGTGASASTCMGACQKLVSCSLIKVGDEAACESSCQMSAYQYQIDCVNNTDCTKIASTCGNPTGGGTTPTIDGGTGDTDAGNIMAVGPCEMACSTLSENECITGTDIENCETLCENSSAAIDTTFSSCVSKAGSDCTGGTACYNTLKSSAN